MTTSYLLWTILFSSVGLGYFLYGRKQKRAVPFVCGILLMTYPYFFDGDLEVVVVGLLLSAVPYFIVL